MALLFMLQNRECFLTVISSDPDAAYHFSNCLEKIRCCEDRQAKKKIVYSSLVLDLFRCADPTLPLFDVPVLLQVWMFLVFDNSNPKEFLGIMKSKLTQQHLENLYAVMLKEAQFEQFKHRDEDKTDKSRSIESERAHKEYLNGLHASLVDFGRKIGMTHLSTNENPVPQGNPVAEKDGDIEVCL